MDTVLMRRILIVLIVLLNSFPAEARRAPNNIGARHNSDTGTLDYCLKVQSEDGSVVNDKCKPLYVSDEFITDEGDFFLIRANIGGTSGTSMTTSDTTVSTSYKYIRKAIASSANPGFDTGTLSDGAVGQILTIQITEVGAGGTWTLTPETKTGFTSLLFEAVGDMVTLLFVNGDIGWIVLSQESVQMVN